MAEAYALSFTDVTRSDVPNWGNENPVAIAGMAIAGSAICGQATYEPVTRSDSDSWSVATRSDSDSWALVTRADTDSWSDVH